jgi:putative methyltransferase
MSLRVTFIELSVYENILPLVSGSLQAFAQSDPEVAQQVDFSIRTWPVTADEGAIVDSLTEARSDVYAMSWYIWNAGAMRRVLERLHEARPDANFLLGGPQVMNSAAEYVPAMSERVAVCNGEGERTFLAYLQHLLSGSSIRSVPGLSCYRDGEMFTTEAPPRVNDLSELPSPFQSGVFEGGDYTVAVLETNRGCPYRCAFCFWGAATNDKVYRHDVDRIKADITWLSEHHFINIFIADANWGILPRDLELTDHIVECRKKNGYPLMIVAQAAKNKPERMAEITSRFVAGGLVTTQPVSLQTTDPTALDLIDRKNIKEETYTFLQSSLREQGISSFVELIWPLPGETLDTFHRGIDKLCRMRADTIIVYPQLLLPNTTMRSRVDTYGLVVERAPSHTAEADIVVATRWVNKEECRQGTWFYYALHTAYNARTAYFAATYLDRHQIASYSTFIDGFARHLQRHPGTDFADFVAASVDSRSNYDLLNNGRTIHLALHELREQVQKLLREYMSSESWWDDHGLRLAFDLDCLTAPYVYREPVREPLPLSRATIVDMTRDTYQVALPPEGIDLIADELVKPDLLEDGVGRLEINHAGRGKMPYMARKSIDHNSVYCQAMIERLRDILPTVTASNPGLARQSS